MIDAADRLYERVLIVRCQTGEAAALAELIGRYGPRLRFYLRKLAGDAAADDLLQEVWIDVFRRIARLNDPAAFGGWVYRIARDKAYRLLRSRRTPVAIVDDNVADDAAEEPRWTAEEIAQLRDALDRLSLAHREVLVLQFVEAMTYEQIATLIECPVGTIRSRVHHAKRALRAAMECPKLKVKGRP